LPFFQAVPPSSTTNPVVQDLPNDDDDTRIDGTILNDIDTNNNPTPPQTTTVVTLSDSLRFRSAWYDLLQAGAVGILTGLSVSVFKLSIEQVRNVAYSRDFLSQSPYANALVPCIGGILVGLLLCLGPLPAGLVGTVQQVDRQQQRQPQNNNTNKDTPTNHVFGKFASIRASLRKSIAAVVTLGTGNSLGPEGPCVEIGMTVARMCMAIPTFSTRDWNRRLLACGAAAGVAAGFDAPIAGVFFALEIMQNAFDALDVDVPSSEKTSATVRLFPILLSSVLSSLTARSLLGQHLVLKVGTYSLQSPLAELPLYLLLGIVCGGVAFGFSRAAQLSQQVFDNLPAVPVSVKPALGALVGGVVGLVFPQILFNGYETLNALLANQSTSTGLLLSLLGAKIVTTAVAAGSGLVGGTFAPSLFLGAMTGASFYNVAQGILTALQLPSILADVPAYAMVGAASVLSALFRAPLTASMVLFELTRDYDVIVPLMVSAGFGSVIADTLEDKFQQRQERRNRRDKDAVSWGDLSK